MDEIYNKGKLDVTSIFQVGYELDNMYFVLGYFKTLEKAEENFEKIKIDPRAYMDCADLIFIRKFPLEKLHKEFLDFQNIKEIEIEI